MRPNSGTTWRWKSGTSSVLAANRALAGGSTSLAPAPVQRTRAATAPRIIRFMCAPRLQKLLTPTVTPQPGRGNGHVLNSTDRVGILTYGGRGGRTLRGTGGK